MITLKDTAWIFESMYVAMTKTNQISETNISVSDL